MNDSALPLKGVKVLDLSRVLAGPYCCALLADMGADVIKVERPGVGDENRGWGELWSGCSLDFLNVNRGKRGITVDLAHESGRRIIETLSAEVDVLLESFPSGTMQRFGLGYDTLRVLNPRLVYCSLSAFGPQGPLSGTPGYDGTIQAFSGIMSMTGEADGGPVRCGPSVVDMGTGLAAYGAVLSALFARQRSSEGQQVFVSLLQTALAFLGSHAAAFRMTGQLPKRSGAGVGHLAPYGAYRTLDSYVVTGALNEQSWRRFCGALARDDLTSRPEFATLADRVAHRRELDSALQDIFSMRTSAQWCERFEAAGVAISVVQTIADLLAHPQVAANAMMVTVDHPRGALDLVAAPMSFSGFDVRPRRAPPALGEHTDEVLASIGLSGADIAALRDGGIV